DDVPAGVQSASGLLEIQGDETDQRTDRSLLCRSRSQTSRTKMRNSPHSSLWRRLCHSVSVIPSARLCENWDVSKVNTWLFESRGNKIVFTLFGDRVPIKTVHKKAKF